MQQIYDFLENFDAEVTNVILTEKDEVIYQGQLKELPFYIIQFRDLFPEKIIYKNGFLCIMTVNRQIGRSLEERQSYWEKQITPKMQRQKELNSFLKDKTISIEIEESYVVVTDKTTGVTSHGSSIEEALEMLKEAVELYLE